MKIRYIKKIECKSKRYDIETRKYKCFFANNILVHNCSFAVNYNNGKVVSASTRGDGEYGKDITDKAKIFCGDIKYKGNVWLRGEAMLVGKNIHESLGFKNRRNGAAGILNRDDNKNAEQITPFFYEVLNYRDFMDGTDELSRVKWIEENIVSDKNYSPLIFLYEKKNHDIPDIINFYNKVDLNDSYDIDGLVITPMDYERDEVLYPENKIAFKINEEPVDAIVKEVMWCVTRTGRIMPLININPIEIQGTTVSKATGFNAKYVQDNCIGKGSKIRIILAGSIIPYVVDVKS